MPRIDLDDVGHRVLAEQHAAERALLGEEVVRRRALGVSGRRPGRDRLRDRYGRSTRSLLTSRVRSGTTVTVARACAHALVARDGSPSARLSGRPLTSPRFAAVVRRRRVHTMNRRPVRTTQPVDNTGENLRETPWSVCRRCVETCGQQMSFGAVYAPLTGSLSSPACV